MMGVNKALLFSIALVSVSFSAAAEDGGFLPSGRIAVGANYWASHAATLRRTDTASSPRGVLRRACDEPCAVSAFS